MTYQGMTSLPSVDVFVFGQPCQPFSDAGKNLGSKDARGNLVKVGLKYMSKHYPSVAIMEKVAGLPKRHPKMHKYIMKSIRKMGSGAYQVHQGILNTRDHGIPQTRKRLYVVALLQAKIRAPFQFPRPIPCLPLRAVLNMRHHGSNADLPEDKVGITNLIAALEKLIQHGHNPLSKNILFMCDIYCGLGRTVHCMKNTSPCITASRASNKGFWVTGLQRMTTLDELMMLQGMRRDRLDIHGISRRQIGLMCGNAMSVNVLTRLLAAVLPAVSALTPVDPWKPHV